MSLSAESVSFDRTDIFPLVVVDDVLWPSDSIATLIPSSQLPDPYRGLLAHQLHMTVAVEEFFGQSVDVVVLRSGREGNRYHREIVLLLEGTERIVQSGLVRIDLDCCAPAVRDAILEEKTPLGRILIDNKVLRRVEPTSFLSIEPGESLLKMLKMTKSQRLYGRTGVIFFDDRPAIAVLEILAPIDKVKTA